MFIFPIFSRAALHIDLAAVKGVKNGQFDETNAGITFIPGP